MFDGGHGSRWRRRGAKEDEEVCRAKILTPAGDDSRLFLAAMTQKLTVAALDHGTAAMDKTDDGGA
ncbi:MAG: hypothetical protein J0I86_11170, partial [Mesorhizobium sp.]|nr:hypothetical protein [Mesorhizobium sp.]